MSRVDEAAVRNAQGVDIVLPRSDLDRARKAMEKAGFIYRHAASIDMFLDGEGAKARDAAHVVFANQKVREDYVTAAPDVDESKPGDMFRGLTLGALAGTAVITMSQRH